MKEEIQFEEEVVDDSYVEHLEDSYFSEDDEDDDGEEEEDEYSPQKEEIVKKEKKEKKVKKEKSSKRKDRRSENGQFACEECGQSFKQKRLLNQHQARVHEKVVRFSCFVCQKGFYDRHHMLGHLSVHDDARKSEERTLPEDLVIKMKEDGKVVFQGKDLTQDLVCSFCNKIFDRRGGKERHERETDCEKKQQRKKFSISRQDVDKDENSSKEEIPAKLETEEEKNLFPCQDCGRSLPSADSLDIHMKIHLEQNVVPCTAWNCTATFPTQKELLDHKLADHGMSRETASNWTCEECGKIFKSKGELKMHMRRHNPDKNFVCNECGKKFKRETGLKYHILGFHKGILNYSCDECGKSEVSPAALAVHKRNKHMAGEHMATCQVCGQVCHNKYTLTRHMTRHTDERKFFCPWEGCGKKFRMAEVLKCHEKLHIGIKDYQCPMCPKQFMQQQQLTYHIKRHNGIKDHECQTCGKCFVEPAGARNCKHSGMQDIKTRL